MRNLETRLKKVEAQHAPPREPRIIPIVAADDPEAQELIAAHEQGELGRSRDVTLIVLTGVPRSPRFGEW